ncbi:hypothetical protein [Candidatus Phytoplasma oryzae]|uniref:hypothetical protein n=1 Tax=Candidatus Phytoplasma oryzae TaxID=203274 RepID=UPI000AD57001|nr:hypothetical protein [Candidatus Phytoplasma oryzae]
MEKTFILPLSPCKGLFPFPWKVSPLAYSNVSFQFPSTTMILLFPCLYLRGLGR